MSCAVSTAQAAQEALKQLTTERPEGEALPEIQVGLSNGVQHNTRQPFFGGKDQTFDSMCERRHPNASCARAGLACGPRSRDPLFPLVIH